MADYKLVDAEKLDGDLTVLAEAIRQRSGTAEKLAFPQGMAETVKNIPAEGIVLPELSNPASATDIAEGKTLYDDEGNPVTGTLVDFKPGYEGRYIFGTNPRVSGSTTLMVEAESSSAASPVIHRTGSTATVRIPSAAFGDATPAQVAKGATFTSAAGLLVEGTHECEGGVTLPELGDTAAQPTDMVAGKVLYDDAGTLVTGNLYEVLEGKVIAAQDYLRLLENNGNIETLATMRIADFVVRKNSVFRTTAPASAFGDATPAQVAKGATFTSAAGLLVEGTHECEGGITLPELSNAAAATDLAYDKQLIGADGEIITGTLGEVTEGATIFATGEVTLQGSAGATEFAVGAVYSPRNIGNNTVGCILRPGAVMTPRHVPTSLFGDALPEQVAKGATFTSAAGLLVEGTHECEGGVTLPELGDTAAQPSDIASGKVLYDDEGNPVTGTLVDFKPGYEGRYIFGTNPRVSGSTTLMVEAESSSAASPVIHRTGSTATVRIPSAAFGDATPAQVAKGATFTSAAGLLVEGTLEAASGGVDMHMDGETLVITGAATVENETLIL